MHLAKWGIILAATAIRTCPRVDTAAATKATPRMKIINSRLPSDDTQIKKSKTTHRRRRRHLRKGVRSTNYTVSEHHLRTLRASTDTSANRSKKTSYPVPIIKTELVGGTELAVEAIPEADSGGTAANSKRATTKATPIHGGGSGETAAVAAAIKAANEKQVGSYLLSASPRQGGMPVSPSLRRINKLLGKK